MGTLYNGKKVGAELQNLVDGIDEFVLRYGAPSAKESLEAQALILAGKLVECVERFPQPCLALARCRLVNLSFASQVTLSTAIYTAWYFRQQNYIHQGSVMLVASALCAGTGIGNSHQEISPDKALVKSFQRVKQHKVSSKFWQSTQFLLCGSAVSQQHLAHLGLTHIPEATQMINMIFKMCWYSHQADSRTTVESYIRSAWLKNPEKQIQINRFISDLGSSFPGAIVECDDEHGVVLGERHGMTLAVTLTQSSRRYLWIDNLHLRPISAPLKIKSANQIAPLWQTSNRDEQVVTPLASYNSQFALDELHPSADLAQLIQGNLDEHNDIETISAVLQHSPQLTQTVCEIASRESRQKMSVKEIKHAILLLGLERTPRLLTLLSFQQQLTATQTPYTQQLQMFLAQINTAAQVVADQVKIHLGEQIALYVSIYLIPFFLAKSKTLSWPQKQSDNLSQPGSSVDCWEKSSQCEAEFNQKAWRFLIDTWQLPSTLLEAFSQLHLHPRQMQLSKRIMTLNCEMLLTILAVKLIRDGELTHKVDSDIVAHACATLALPSSSWPKTVQQTIELASPNCSI